MSNELRGSEFLLQIEDPTDPGVYLTLGGLKSKTMSLNKETVDVTNHGSEGWRQLLSGAGIQSLDMSGDGVTNKVAALKWLFLAFTQRTFANVKLSMLLGAENVVTVTCAADITSIEFSGENDKEVPYSLSLSSAEKPIIDVF